MNRTPGETEDRTADDTAEPTTIDVPDDDTVDDAADDDAAVENVERRRRPSQRALAATIIVSLMVMPLFAMVSVALWFIRAPHNHQQRDAAITVAAREEVLALLTLSPDSVQASLDRVLGGSTGGWRQQFAQEADQFTSIVRAQQVRATATITASGIQSADDSRATVLVSADAVIHNTQSPQGYPGVYRVLENLVLQDGTWLVSDLQFVA